MDEIKQAHRKMNEAKTERDDGLRKAAGRYESERQEIWARFHKARAEYVETARRLKSAYGKEEAAPCR
jgi:hypothetical protein